MQASTRSGITDSHASRIAPAVALIRAAYAEALTVENWPKSPA
ncbi:hypothetical protein X773_16625 [Mesorhizobium sp. LSJC285A00]|nr:hypothetical protein X773_16625 [Mesorhizobium sp. LSJC285A00]